MYQLSFSVVAPSYGVFVLQIVLFVLSRPVLGVDLDFDQNLHLIIAHQKQNTISSNESFDN
jgi:hypothetical protein